MAKDKAIARLVAAMQNGAKLVVQIEEGRPHRRLIHARYSPRQATIERALQLGAIKASGDGLLDGDTQTFHVANS